MTTRRSEPTDFEWSIISPSLANKPRGVPRADDRRVLNGIYWRLRPGSPGPPFRSAMAHPRPRKIGVLDVSRTRCMGCSRGGLLLDTSPRNSRIERGLGVSSHQSGSASASLGGRAATSAWCLKFKKTVLPYPWTLRRAVAHSA